MGELPVSAAAKVQARVAGIAMAIILGVSLVSGGAQAFIEHPKAEDQTEQIATERHFWNAIAGNESVSAATVENQLAIDLAAADDLSSFRGDSNRYGGITDAIGFDPFNGAGLNCSECGPLKADVQAKAELARSGKVSQVISSVEATPDTSTVSLTPWGMGFLTYLVALWVLIGYSSYVAAEALTKGPWKLDWRMKLSAPLIALGVAMRLHSERKKIRDRVSSVFPDAYATIDRVDDFLRRLPDNESSRSLRARRDEVEAELKRQASADHSDRDEEALRVMTDSLQSVSDAIEVRTSVWDALDGLDRDAGMTKPVGRRSQG